MMMSLRFLVSLPLLVLALLALSFQQDLAGPTTLSSVNSAASSQPARPFPPSFVAAAIRQQPAAESRTLAGGAGGAGGAAVAPPLLTKRADPVAENKTEPAKPAGARMPKCVRKTGVADYANPGFLQFTVFWTRTYEISELEQEGVSDKDLEDKLKLETRRRCSTNVYKWEWFPNKGDGKGATVILSKRLFTKRKCVQNAFRDAGFPKDFKC